MESVEIKGDFVLINGKTSIRFSDIVSVKPQSIVIVDPDTGKIMQRDFSKIIVRTTHDTFEFLYSNDKRRDEILQQLNEAIILHQTNRTTSKTDGQVTINVSDSNNINIVSGSKNVSITSDAKKELKKIVQAIKSELEKSNIPDTQKQDIIDCTEDIQTRVDENKEIKQYSIKNLIGLTSDLSQISSLAITVGQLLGFIPK